MILKNENFKNPDLKGKLQKSICYQLHNNKHDNRRFLYTSYGNRK